MVSLLASLKLAAVASCCRHPSNAKIGRPGVGGARPYKARYTLCWEGLGSARGIAEHAAYGEKATTRLNGM